MGKLLINDRNCQEYLRDGALVVPKGAMVAPSARDAASKAGLKIIWESDLNRSSDTRPAKAGQKKPVEQKLVENKPCPGKIKSDIKRILRESFGVEKSEHISQLTAEVMKKIK